MHTLWMDLAMLGFTDAKILPLRVGQRQGDVLNFLSKITRLPPRYAAALPV